MSPLLRWLAFAAASIVALQRPAWAAAPDAVAAMPLIEQATTTPGDTLAVLYSGDGGWTGVDRGVADVLAKAGVPTVGVNSLRYFWTRRTPRDAAADLAAVIGRYQARWRRSRVVLIGYSFGADALPIIVANLPAEVRKAVRLTALVAMDHEGELEFHVGDWLNQTASTAYTIAPVLADIGPARLICIYGEREKDDACPTFAPGLIKPVRLAGGHHFDGDYDAVGRAILNALR